MAAAEAICEAVTRPNMRFVSNMAAAEAICEAVTRPNMRFVSIKTPEQ